MATTNITVKHRLNRIGFLVRPGELKDVERAAEICTLLWGGVRNPIIPVAAADDANADELLKTFQLDALFPVASTDAIDGFLARYPYHLNPRMQARELLFEDWNTKKKKVAYLDVLNAIEKYWAQEFKHAPPHRESRCRLVRWQAGDNLRELFAVLYGSYPSDLNLKEDFAGGFLRGLRATDVQIELGGQVPGGLERAITPIRLTGVDLQGYGGARSNWIGGVYFGDAKDAADLTAFWNLRAAGNDIEFAPLTDLGRIADMIRAHLKYLNELPNQHPTIENHIVACYRQGRDHQQIASLLGQLSTTKKSLCAPCDGSHLTHDPALFCFDREQALAFIESEAETYSALVTLPEKQFLVHSDRFVDDQSLAVSIEEHVNFGYPDHTLSPPFCIELTEIYGRKIGIDPWTIRSEKEGIGVFITAGDKRLRLKPIKETDVMEALLSQAGLSIEPSAAGRLANRLLEALGGLEDARVFKIRGVRQLVDALSSQTAIGRGDASKAIWNDGQFQDHEQLYIEHRTTPKLTTHDAFDFLLRKNFFRAGLELICDHCGLTSWLSLRQIDDDWVCEYCGHVNKTSLHIRHRGDWKFRRSGLLAKETNQEGAIPVLLSLLSFERVVHFHEAMRMTSVKFTKGVPECEIDFMLLRHKGDRIDWVLGEAKSAGGEINQDDLTHMKAIADALRKIGIRPYLAFSKTADTFNASELELFRSARAQGYSIILLTNKEIEPYHPYMQSPDADQLPHKYSHSFDDMAANSAYRYLRSTQG
jgi:hypothetical protein